MNLLPGVIAFFLFLVFDFNKIKWHNRLCNLLFALGGILLAWSTASCIDLSHFIWNARSIFGLILLAASAAALIYTLFFALPFQSTYTRGNDLPVVSTGVYGLCRHPAFWPFLLLYAALWLTFGGNRLLLAAVVYPVCNWLYIYVQDRCIFPQYIHGYDTYRLSVPFLIPRRKR